MVCPVQDVSGRRETLWSHIHLPRSTRQPFGQTINQLGFTPSQIATAWVSLEAPSCKETGAGAFRSFRRPPLFSESNVKEVLKSTVTGGHVSTLTSWCMLNKDLLDVVVEGVLDDFAEALCLGLQLLARLRLSGLGVCGLVLRVDG